MAKSGGDGGHGGARRAAAAAWAPGVGTVERRARVAAAAAGIGDGGELLEVGDGDHRQGAILAANCSRRQIVGADSAPERVCAGAPASASARRPLVRANSARQSGDDHDFAASRPGRHTDRFWSSRSRSRCRRKPGSRRRRALPAAPPRPPASGGQGPILGVFEVRGSRRGGRRRPPRAPPPPAAAASAAPTGHGRRVMRRLALLRHNLFGHQLIGIKYGCSGPVGLGRAASRLKPHSARWLAM